VAGVDRFEPPFDRESLRLEESLGAFPARKLLLFDAMLSDEPLDIEAVGTALAKTLENRPKILWETRFSIELGRWLVGEAIYLGLACASAILLAKVIELPALAVRAKLFPRKAPSVMDSGPALSRTPLDRDAAIA